MLQIELVMGLPGPHPDINLAGDAPSSNSVEDRLINFMVRYVAARTHDDRHGFDATIHRFHLERMSFWVTLLAIGAIVVLICWRLNIHRHFVSEEEEPCVELPLQGMKANHANYQSL